MKRKWSFLVIILSLILTSCKKSLQEVTGDDITHSLRHREATNEALQVVSYTFAKLFDVPSTENQQGLAFGAGSHFVTFDIGSGNGRIVQYNSSGTHLSALALWH